MGPRRAFHAATLAVLAACGHGDPFQVPDPRATGPLTPGPLARLTYSAGRDQAAAWGRAPAGGIYYTLEDVDSPTRGWCLGLLPDSGGSRLATWCERTSPDSQAAFDEASPGPGGALAFLRAIGFRFAPTPSDWALMVAPDGRQIGRAHV